VRARSERNRQRWHQFRQTRDRPQRHQPDAIPAFIGAGPSWEQSRLLETLRSIAGLSVFDLWLGQFALGGELSFGALDRVLAGDAPISEWEYQVCVAAVWDSCEDTSGRALVRAWDVAGS
jgi:hypothetical protein